MARKLSVCAMLMLVLVGFSGQVDTQLLPEYGHTTAGEQLYQYGAPAIAGAQPISEYEQNFVGTQLLTDDEQNIADVLVHVVHNLLDMRGSGEHPIIALLEDSVIEVSYVQGYFWLGCGYEDKELIEVAPEGITCFLRTPEPSWDGQTHAVINLGRSKDGNYVRQTFGFHPLLWSLEDHFNDRLDYQPLENHMQTFELYIPPRIDFRMVASIETGYYDSNDARIRIRYPQVVGVLNSEDEAKLNELIRSEALLVLSRFEPDSIESFSLAIDFEVKLLNSKALSIVYTGIWVDDESNLENNFFYSTNIDMQRIRKMHLDDYIFVSKRLVDKLRGHQFIPVGGTDGSEYNAALVFVFGELSDDEIIDSLRCADLMNNPYHIYSYLTEEDKLGISFGLPQAMGGHAEYEIELSELVNVLRGLI